MAQSAPSIVFGTAGIAAFSTEESNKILDILEKHNIKQLDTASVYVGPRSSEAFSGRV